MEKSSQIAWKIVPLRCFFPLKVVPLIEVLLYYCTWGSVAWGAILLLCPSGLARSPNDRVFWGAFVRSLNHNSTASIMERFAPGPIYLGLFCRQGIINHQL
jgi:hypothetical protein